MGWIKKASFILIGAGSTAVACILVLELVFGNWLWNDGWWATRNLNIVRNRRIVFDVEHLYGKAKPISVYTRDRYGLRGDCHRPDQIQIITLGGSTTDQRYITDGETFQDALEQQLSQQGKRKICVANAGVDGHSTFGHLASLERWLPLIPDVRPKFFLLYIGINDAGFRLKPRKGYDVQRDSNILLHIIAQNSAIYALGGAIKNSVDNYFDNRKYSRHAISRPSPDRYTSDSPSKGVEPLVRENGRGFADRLNKIVVEIGKKYGAKVICVSQPHLFVMERNGKLYGLAEAFQYEGKFYNGLDYQMSLEEINRIMRMLCTRENVYFIDLAKKSFSAEDFYDLVHLSPKGAKTIARYLFQEMERQGITKELLVTLSNSPN